MRGRVSVGRASVLAYDGSSRSANGPVRVSYFDPRTGEPRETPCKPLRGRRKPDSDPLHKVTRMSNKQGWKGCVVDGVEYPSLAKGAEAVGVCGSTLGQALLHGMTEYKGHAIAYAEGRKR